VSIGISFILATVMTPGPAEQGGPGNVPRKQGGKGGYLLFGDPTSTLPEAPSCAIL
jgi:hypothetical protein